MSCESQSKKYLKIRNFKLLASAKKKNTFPLPLLAKAKVYVGGPPPYQEATRIKLACLSFTLLGYLKHADRQQCVRRFQTQWWRRWSTANLLTYLQTIWSYAFQKLLMDSHYQRAIVIILICRHLRFLVLKPFWRTDECCSFKSIE